MVLKRGFWLVLHLVLGLPLGLSALAETDSILHPLSSQKGTPVLGLYGGAGREGYDQAVNLGITYIFPSVHWYADHGWMKDKVKQAHADGIKVCPSYGTAGDGYGDDHSEFFKQHPEWWEVRQDGSKTNKDAHVGLSFGIPEVRRHKVDTFIKYAREYDLDGILLDYTRMFDRTCGYHPTIVQEFTEQTGRDPHKLPNNDPQWVRYRAEYVTAFVRELREAANALAAKRGRPAELLACVDPDPDERLFSVLQDWRTWVDEGLIQGVVTMVYHRDPNETIEKVRLANAICRGKVWHMPMIAPYHYYLTTDELLIDASLKCLKTGTGALAFYREDYISKYAQWDALSEVASWTNSEIAEMRENFVRNPGFELSMESWANAGNSNFERVEQTQYVRLGKAAMRMTGPGGLWQVVDLGLPEQAASLTISCWLKLEPAHQGDVFIDVCVNMGQGKEFNYRVPVLISDSSDWQQFTTNLPVDKSLELNHIQLEDL